MRIAPVVADADETSARWEIHPLAEMAPLIRSCLAASADESRHLIVVSDANGILLWVEGNPHVRMRAADSMNFAEGTLWSEGGAGTNAIGTALAAEHAVQVFASEHFNEVVQEWTCAAAPVHDPDTGAVIGVIDLTGEMSTVHPHSMAVATATAQAVEAQLRCQMLDRDGRLLARYGDQLNAGSEPRALVAPSGRVIASQPLGWLPVERLGLPAGGGELPVGGERSLVAEVLGCEEAYVVSAAPVPAAKPAPEPRRRRGADPQPVGSRPWHAELNGPATTCGCATERSSPAVRTSRGHDQRGAEPGGLRQRRPGRLDSGRDVAPAQAVGRLDRDRALRLAAAWPATSPRCADCCTAARSARRRLATRGRCCRRPAPRLVREREGLEGWLRQSVMSTGDRDAVWAWVQTPSGSTDLAAWQRLLVNLPFQDPRRSLAASRVGQLRGHQTDRLIDPSP